MLIAQIQGKLPLPDEGSEDLLTSNVFGAFKYSGRFDALSAFLAMASLREGAAPLPPFVSIDYTFWPWLEGDACPGCEPDVVLRVEHLDQTTSLIGIEAKYHAGKSSLPTVDGPVSDQLGRQWLALRKLATAEGRTRCILVYLTADIALPQPAFDQTEGELARKCPGVVADLRWLSWRALPMLLAGYSDSILVDLVTLLRRAKLTWFEGISPPPAQLPAPYMFLTEINSSDGSDGAANFTWPTPPPPALWSFSS